MSEQSAAMSVALKRCPTTFKVRVFQKRVSKRVLFLEAGKDFVDTLLSFLLLPVGTILHILSQGRQPSWGSSYAHVMMERQSGILSIFESLDFLKLHVDKQDLVQRRPSAPGCTACGSSCSSLPVLGDLEAAGIFQRPPPESQVVSKSGFLEETSTIFIVTDSLDIRPSTTMSIMNALKKLQLSPGDELESIEIAVSFDQILQLLQVARTSETSLTDVFRDY